MKLRAALGLILWISGVARASVNRGEFEKTLAAAQAVFEPLAVSHHESLNVFGVWAEDWVNANSKRWPPDFIVTVYGGLARQPEMTTDALALVVCHELGHGYGGPPYRDAYNQISVEGQADYWGGQPECAHVLLGQLDAPVSPLLDAGEEQALLEQCSSDPVCRRVLVGARGVLRTLAQLHGEPMPRLDQQDLDVAPHTDLGHPKTYQCRLDTWIAAQARKPRPACWFKDE